MKKFSCKILSMALFVGAVVHAQQAPADSVFHLPGTSMAGKQASGVPDKAALQDVVLQGFDKDTQAVIKADPSKYALASQILFVNSLPYLKMDSCKGCSPMEISQIGPMVDLYGLAAVLKNVSLATTAESQAAAAADQKAAENTKTVAWNVDQASKVWLTLSAAGSTAFARTQLGQVSLPAGSAPTTDQNKKSNAMGVIPNGGSQTSAGTGATSASASEQPAANLDQPSAAFGKPLDFSAKS